MITLIQSISPFHSHPLALHTYK